MKSGNGASFGDEVRRAVSFNGVIRRRLLSSTDKTHEIKPIKPKPEAKAKEVLESVADRKWRFTLRAVRASAVFGLGFVCCFLYFAITGTPPVRSTAERAATMAGAAVAKAMDEMLTAASPESLLNATTKLKAIMDLQFSDFSGRFASATTGLSEGFVGLLANATRPDWPSVPWPMRGQEVEKERVGRRMARKGARAYSPVVMIPGIITTGLEVWDGEECMRAGFRQRIWGSATMLQTIMRDSECWVRHLSLNSTTGLDPLQSPHFNRTIRVRPAQGFESADFFFGGYWLWGPMIEALADIGYDVNSMHMASFDWRLSFEHLEKRDRYFTRLRQNVETLVSTNEVKATIVVHSMGGNLWHYFMQWVTHRVDPDWVNKYIRSEILISSPMLGLPKAFYSLLAGDNRDFAGMGTGFHTVINHFFTRMSRRSLWRSCSSLAMMAPMGGESIWGEELNGEPLVRLGRRAINVTEAYDLLAKEGDVPQDLQRIAPWLLDGMRRSSLWRADEDSNATEPPERFWANPLAVPLPWAPDLRKYSFYGIGVQTEFSAVFEDTGDEKTTPRYILDVGATADFGFVFGNGDYSVPVHSLGLMCLRGWNDTLRNPSGTRCTTKEFPDEPAPVLSGGFRRGGPKSGDHIDILGNQELLEDVLKVVSGMEEVQERIVSNLPDIASQWGRS